MKSSSSTSRTCPTSTRARQTGKWLEILAAVLLLPAALTAQAPAAVNVTTLVPALDGAVGGVAVDRAGYVYVADFGDTVWKITPDGRVSPLTTSMYGASGNAVDARGNLYQSNFYGHYVARIDRAGTVEIVADEGLAGPVGIALEPDGHFFVTNCNANSLSRVTPAGEVSTFAASPLFRCPNGIVRDRDGTLYVVNFGDDRLLKVTGEGEVGELARLPGGGNGHVTIARGDLYATSFAGHRVYRVSLAGEVTLIAGTGGLGEKDGPGPEAKFSWPNGIAAGPLGDRLYVNDFVNRWPPGIERPPAPKSALRQILLPSFAGVLEGALEAGGIDAMAAAYRAWKSSPSTAAQFTEIEVNRLAYRLMGSAEQLPAAIRLLELNLETYPNSWNAHDSLAEAHAKAGNVERAIELYEKSLELNPANENGKAMLEKLRE